MARCGTTAAAPPDHGFVLAYERHCDYVSGYALAIRRQLWHHLAGFLPALSAGLRGRNGLQPVGALDGGGDIPAPTK